MMLAFPKAILIIACEEWRYWLRSRLALFTVALFAFILISVSLLTWERVQTQTNERAHHQLEAEQTFVDQPDRHPHRMVHFGHYAFRTPAPLSLFDPGLDSVTGQSIFLEGHHQNTAMFSNATAKANLGGLSWLTPALIYQLFSPLLIVLLGYGAITREREAKTLVPLLAKGISGQMLTAGKALALFGFVVILLLPVFVSSVLAAAIGAGETILSALALTAVYGVYLAIWSALTLLMSIVFRKRSTVIASLVALWLFLVLLMPSIAITAASSLLPLKGKIETDLAMLAAVRGVSDGHNISAEAYDKLQQDLFKQQGVGKVEELSVNIRGLVAQNSEQRLTEAMNVFADKRMAGEVLQANLVAGQGWLSPTLAIAKASRIIAGTDLKHYHNFLRETEELRYNFVQGLNKVHAEQLDYIADINRNVNDSWNKKTRMDASNWQLLQRFKFSQDNITARLAHASMPITRLFVWLLILLLALVWSSARLKP